MKETALGSVLGWSAGCWGRCSREATLAEAGLSPQDPPCGLWAGTAGKVSGRWGGVGWLLPGGCETLVKLLAYSDPQVLYRLVTSRTSRTRWFLPLVQLLFSNMGNWVWLKGCFCELFPPWLWGCEETRSAVQRNGGNLANWQRKEEKGDKVLKWQRMRLTLPTGLGWKTLRALYLPCCNS